MGAALKWILVLLVLTEAGFMVFDGIRALTVGDYVTPKSGPHAGQLGGWSKIAEAVGIGPRSTLMKCIFVGYGGAWLVVLGFFLAGSPWAPRALLGFAVGSLWYLPVGTVLGAVQILLLALLLLR